MIKVIELNGSPPPRAEGKQPDLLSRRIEDSVMIASGQTVVSRGDATHDQQKVKDKIPMFGDIPVVGNFFPSESLIEFKKELIVMITLTEIDRIGRALIPSGTSR